MASEPGGGLTSRSRTPAKKEGEREGGKAGGREGGAVPWDLELPRRQPEGRNPCLSPSSPLTFHQCFSIAKPMEKSGKGVWEKSFLVIKNRVGKRNGSESKLLEKRHTVTSFCSFSEISHIYSHL